MGQVGEVTRTTGTPQPQAEDQSRSSANPVAVQNNGNVNESDRATTAGQNDARSDVGVRSQYSYQNADLALLGEHNRNRIEQNLLTANNGNAGAAQPAPVAQQLSLNRAELERRAQHIFERFQDDGTLGITSPETAYSEIEGDLNGLNSADVRALREIYSQRYSPRRGGRDLLLDVRSEIPQMSDRLKAFRILAPENIHPQLEPQATFGNDPGIVADPPRNIVATGTTVKYTLNEGAQIRPQNARSPDITYLIQDENRQPQTLFGRSFEGHYNRPGPHQVTFEVTYPNQPPQYYTLRPEARTPQDLAQSTVNGLPGTAPDPDVLMAALDQETTNVEQQLNTLRANPQANANQIRQLENTLSQLREIKAEVRPKLFDGAIARAIPLRAALIAQGNSQSVPLQLYAKPLSNNRWAIVDLTIPTESRIYEGGAGATPEEGLRSAWNTFVAQNNLPAGQIAANLPTIPPGYQRPAGFPAQFNFGASESWNRHSDGQSDYKTWSDRAGVASMIFTGLGVLSLFGPGTQVAAPFLFGAAGVTGATAGGLNIADRTTYGNFQLQSVETALDGLGVVGGVAQLGGAIAAARNIGTATVRLANGTSIAVRQADELGNRLLTITSAVDNAAGVTNGVIVGATYARQIDEINADPRLSPQQKQQQTREVLRQAAMFGGLVFLGHTAGTLATRRIAANGAQAERQVLQNLGQGMSGAEIDASITRHGGEMVRWVGTDLQGTAARRLLEEINPAALNGLRDVPARQASELLSVLGKDRLNATATTVGGRRLNKLVESLGPELSSELIDRMVRSGRVDRLVRIGDNVENLVNVTRSRANDLIATSRTMSGNRARREIGPVVSVLVDVRTGRTFEGLNHQEPPTNLHPILDRRLAEYNRRFPTRESRPHYSDPGTHSEIYALDQALKAREAAGMRVTEADLEDFVIYNEWLREPYGAARACPNCSNLLNGVEVLAGKR